ncbi:MAG: 2-C-methyl-D-erythritol 4-phosphate cytidylyltransferase [Kiritimatiellae bacterium]|jgi:2-C-methyl-D-erythritol 4-phosphate cytidylyltransferase|nr:2-C-methyl-D-erythritol 4-phosphate cytidylyltransferase [Kiritimatiellia bacterium]
MNCGIIVAGGKSERMGADIDKAFLSLGTKPVVVYSLLAFEKCRDIDEVVLVVRRDRIDAARQAARMFGCNKVKKIVAGGAQRQQSVSKGLQAAAEDIDIAVVHDGARPCVTSDLITQTINSAKQHGSGVAAVKITDTVKSVEKGVIISETVDRTKLWLVQTPQAFKADLLRKAFAHVEKKKIRITDESSAVELVAKGVRLVVSSSSNIKITTPDDLTLAAALMRLF